MGVILFSTFPPFVHPFVRPESSLPLYRLHFLPILIKLGHNIPIGELGKPIVFGWIILKNGRSTAILNCKFSRFSPVTALQITFFDRFLSNFVTIYLLVSLGSLLFLVGLFWIMADRRPFWIVNLPVLAPLPLYRLHFLTDSNQTWSQYTYWWAWQAYCFWLDYFEKWPIGGHFEWPKNDMSCCWSPV